MKTDIIDYLRCPTSNKPLSLEKAIYNGSEVESGRLVTPDKKHSYKIKGGIPRFVPNSNYSQNFGKQWNLFSKTQLDSNSGHPISAQRFWLSTNWNPDQMKGKWILDAGCGSGRFAEIALKTGANVIAIDYSNSVDACYKNLKSYSNLHVMQCDIYSLPFAENFFDFTYSLGVLQHTPNVRSAFESLIPKLKNNGGKLCVDLYPKSIKSFFWPKYWLRPITKRMDQDFLLKILKKWVPILMPLSLLIGRAPIIGRQLRHIVPIVNYEGILPLNREQLLEWAILDTFDMFAPKYDNPQVLKTLSNWFTESNLNDIEVFKAGQLIGRGRKI